MKNTIKILCLILLATCNLSTWANPIVEIVSLANKATKAVQTIERELPSIRTVPKKALDLCKVTQKQASEVLKELSTLQKELPKEKVVSARSLPPAKPLPPSRSNGGIVIERLNQDRSIMPMTGQPAATDTRPLPPAVQKNKVSPSDWARNFEESIEYNKKMEHLQKQEFIRSEALKCEENVCKVTPAGQNLLNPENRSNYAQKFRNFYNNPLSNIQR